MKRIYFRMMLLFVVDEILQLKQQKLKASTIDKNKFLKNQDINQVNKKTY